jgi:hypothetical protein
MHGAQGHYEPHLTLVKLPRCEKCHGRHPLAYDPPRDAASCPDCGGPASAIGEEVTVDATFVGEPQ